MKLSLLFTISAVCALACFPASAQFTEKILETTDTLKFGREADKLSFFTADDDETAGVVRPVSANQTALTDSTGGSVSNATLADGLTITALTDSSGGSASDTIAAATNTDTLSGTLTGTLANALADLPTITDTPASADALRDDIVTNVVPVINLNFKEIQAELTTQRALNTVLINAVASLAAKVNTARTDISTQNDNDAKTAELVNALRSALVALNLIKGSS
jgi:hypothetical protein